MTPSRNLDEQIMPFGKHKGARMKAVPAVYLDWLAGQDWIAEWPLVLGYVEANRDVIDQELRDQGRI